MSPSSLVISRLQGRRGLHEVALRSWHCTPSSSFSWRVFEAGVKPLGTRSEKGELNAHTLRDGGRSSGGWLCSSRQGTAPISHGCVCGRPSWSSLRLMSTKSRVESKKKRDSARLEFKALRKRVKLMKASMSPEEKLLWRLKRANRKKGVLLQRLKKYELEKDPDPVHDPELITPEQLQALKKIGYKNRNYVPVGRRGVYGGVILNMHMHWKFHETVQIDCHIYKRDDVRTVARDLTRLSGGIVIDIHQKTTIIMYRGRNYKQPKKEMTPLNTLTKRKALFKSTYLQSLESINQHVEEIQAELRALKHKEAKVQKEADKGSGMLISGRNVAADDDKAVDMRAASEASALMEELSEEVPTSEEDDMRGSFSWESDSLDDEEDELLSDSQTDEDNGPPGEEDELTSDSLVNEDLDSADEDEDQLLLDNVDDEDLSDEEEFNYRDAEVAHLARRKTHQDDTKKQDVNGSNKQNDRRVNNRPGKCSFEESAWDENSADERSSDEEGWINEEEVEEERGVPARSSLRSSSSSLSAKSTTQKQSIDFKLTNVMADGFCKSNEVLNAFSDDDRGECDKAEEITSYEGCCNRRDGQTKSKDTKSSRDIWSFEDSDSE